MSGQWDEALLVPKTHQISSTLAGLVDLVFFFCVFFFLAAINIYGCVQKLGIPKWMVKTMENPIKMDDLEVPLFLNICTFVQLDHPTPRFGVVLFLKKKLGSTTT